jgi:hypothetical protein
MGKTGGMVKAVGKKKKKKKKKMEKRPMNRMWRTERRGETRKVYER